MQLCAVATSDDAMTRDIDLEQERDFLAQESPNAILGFLEIRHAALVDPVRVVSDPMDYMVGGKLYLGCPFNIKLVTDTEDAPRTELVVQNVDTRIGEALRAINTRAKVSLEVRSSSDFDLTKDPREERGDSAVIYGFRQFELVDVTVNPLNVSGTLMLRDYSQEPWPGQRATQSRTPGLFR